MSIFTTSFCNCGHDTITGRPIDHECYVLPVTMLAAERRGDLDEANRILTRVDFKRRGLVRGRPAALKADVGNVYDKPMKYHKKLGLYTVKIQDGTRDLPALYEVTFDGGDRALPYGVVEKYRVQQRYHTYIYIPGQPRDRLHARHIDSFVTLEEALQGLSAHHDEHPYPAMG